MATDRGGEGQVLGRIRSRGVRYRTRQFRPFRRSGQAWPVKVGEHVCSSRTTRGASRSGSTGGSTPPPADPATPAAAPRCSPLLVASSTSTLNVKPRLQREGLPAPTTAIAGISDPQEVEHGGDLDTAGRKVKGLRTAQQPGNSGRSRPSRRAQSCAQFCAQSGCALGPPPPPPLLGMRRSSVPDYPPPTLLTRRGRRSGSRAH